jgi:hypothetical protein
MTACRRRTGQTGDDEDTAAAWAVLPLTDLRHFHGPLNVISQLIQMLG